MRAAFLCIGVFLAGFAQASVQPHETEVFVMRDGDVTIDGGPVLSFSKFKKQVEPMLQRKPRVPFRIKSARDTPFETLGRVVLLLQGNGCGKIGFLTEPANQK
jgi:biopolymer transport protein ExbD